MKKPPATGCLFWFILYLWTAPIGIFLINFLDLQYDGGIGWWLAMAYSLPLYPFAEVLPRSLSDGAAVAGYFVALGLVTFLVWRLRRRTTR